MQQSLLPRPFGAARRVASLFRASSRLIALGIMVLLTLGLSSPSPAQDYNEQIIYGFVFPHNTDSNGIDPYGNLITVNGIFYGTTQKGGNPGYGTIFSFDPSTNTETTLYSFTGNGSNGAGQYPEAGLTYDSGTGKLYGTTYYGGSANLGSIFSFDPSSHVVTPLYSFTGQANSNPEYPTTTLTDVNGVLFGTTTYGGANNDGEVFSLNATTLAFTAIHSFTKGTDGENPLSDLTYDSVSGKLFGTAIGGNPGYGVIFSVDPTTNAFSTVYSFTGGTADGDFPQAGMVTVNGILYGTTAGGGSKNGYGTIFSFNPATSMETPLYGFTDTGGDGDSPDSDLAYDSTSGKFYGTTYEGGIYNYGTVFSFDPTTRAETSLYSFNPSYGTTGDGENPTTDLLDVNGTLYGTTTNSAGSTYNYGVIYALTPTTFTLPVASNDTYAPRYQTTYAVNAPGVLGNDNPGGSNRPTATLVTNVTHGTLTLNADGSFTYTPNAGFLGTDTFTYQIANPLGKGNTATVTLTVQPTAPIAPNHYVKVTPNTALSDPAPGVLGGVNNGGSTPITASLVTNVSHGTLTLNSDGSFTYTPTTGYVGQDSFTYQAVNSVGKSNIATTYLTVQPTAPIAVNHYVKVTPNTALSDPAPGVLGGVNNGGSSPMTAILVSNVTHGTLTLNSDGSFTYTPTTGYLGTDTFTYQAVNSIGKSNIATTYLTVQPTAPIAVNHYVKVTHNTILNDPAPGVLSGVNNGGSSPVTAALVANVTHGTLSLKSDGSFVYTPTTGFVGSDSFTYQAINSVGKSNVATTYLTVQ